MHLIIYMKNCSNIAGRVAMSAVITTWQKNEILHHKSARRTQPSNAVYSKGSIKWTFCTASIVL